MWMFQIVLSPSAKSKGLVSLSFTPLQFSDKITRGFDVLGEQCVFLKLFICSKGCACVVIVSFFFKPEICH